MDIDSKHSYKFVMKHFLYVKITDIGTVQNVEVMSVKFYVEFVLVETNGLQNCTIINL
jgi:hypothetical protein